MGFKRFVDGLLAGTLGFGGEESAGASFLRMDGKVWTTDKDGMVPALLGGERSTARASSAIRASCTAQLTQELGEPVFPARRCTGDARAEEVVSRADAAERQKG